MPEKHDIAHLRRRPLTLSLAVGTVEELARLADEEGVRPSHLVERLIHEEAQRRGLGQEATDD